MVNLNLFRNSDAAVSKPAGEVLFREGDAGDVMYVVVEGEVELRVGEHTVETLVPGGIFGELALIDSQPRSATAIARTSCRLVSIDQKRFTFLVQQTPFFALQVMRVLADRLRRMNPSH